VWSKAVDIDEEPGKVLKQNPLYHLGLLFQKIMKDFNVQQ